MAARSSAATIKCLGVLAASLFPLSRKYAPILALLLDRGLSALVATGETRDASNSSIRIAITNSEDETILDGDDWIDRDDDARCGRFFGLRR